MPTLGSLGARNARIYKGLTDVYAFAQSIAATAAAKIQRLFGHFMDKLQDLNNYRDENSAEPLCKKTIN